MMWQSLVKLRRLPGETRIYCGHEYTQANIRFAQTIEGDNMALIARAAEVARAGRRGQADDPDHDGRGEGGQSVPARRPAGDRHRRRPAGKPPAEVFAEIRARKNNF